MGGWIKLINANLLRLTSVTPENYWIEFMQWVTVFIKFNAVIQECKIWLLQLWQNLTCGETVERLVHRSQFLATSHKEIAEKKNF